MINQSQKEKTAPSVSVGADTEQSSQNFTNNIIPHTVKNINPFFEEFRKEVYRTMIPSYLETKTMEEIYDTVYQGKPPIVENVLYPGCYILAGSPKLGKSFMVAQIAYHVSTGTPLWGNSTRQGTVVYLALEDTFERIQTRLYRMFDTKISKKLHFSIESNSIENGLINQLNGFITRYTDNRLIIIDTLQKVRENSGDKYSYSNDYEVITQLKKLSDQYGICILIVHHTRKQAADDKFDMISGTTGLLGAVDGAFILHKESRADNRAILEISGRDQPDSKLHLIRNPESLLWELERTETELWKAPPEPLLERVAAFITKDNSSWRGSPTELVGALGIDMKANTMSMRLNVNASRLFEDYNIVYDNKRTHEGRIITLSLG